MGDTTFAHGGSGYVLSNAAMQRLLGGEGGGLAVAREWDSRIKGVCCGDLALGMALREKGVSVTVAHPLLNGYKPSSFTYGPGQHWCQPVVTMHHVVPAEVSAVWRFERRREMLGEGANVRLSFLRDERGADANGLGDGVCGAVSPFCGTAFDGVERGLG